MINTCGRCEKHDIDSFFQSSGVLSQRLVHTPFIVFEKAKNGQFYVQLFDKVKDLITTDLEDNTQIMCQWKGMYRSDFFKFTLKELKFYYQKYSN